MVLCDKYKRRELLIEKNKKQKVIEKIRERRWGKRKPSKTALQTILDMPIFLN